VARLAEVVTQTFRSFTPEAFSNRLFGDSLDSWWQDYSQLLETTSYGGQVQTAFFITTFAAMGRVSKIDGSVHKAEISLAGSVMDHLKLSTEQKKLAIRLFNEGKQSDFNLDVVLNRFYKLCQHRVSVLQVFIEIQLQLAYADGAVNAKEEAMLQRMSKRLGIISSIYNRIERRVLSNRSAEVYKAQKPVAAKAMSLANACELLGVSRWSAKDDIKQAYRRMLSQHHPDKIIARGASADELAQATEVVQDIKRAYEIICKAKKIR
jgi:DnaJ like chaperone protein